MCMRPHTCALVLDTHLCNSTALPAVIVGGRFCSNIQLYSTGKLVCILPPGYGAAQTVLVQQGGSTRTSDPASLGYTPCPKGSFQNGTEIACPQCTPGFYTSEAGLGKVSLWVACMLPGVLYRGGGGGWQTHANPLRWGSLSILRVHRLLCAALPARTPLSWVPPRARSAPQGSSQRLMGHYSAHLPPPATSCPSTARPSRVSAPKDTSNQLSGRRRVGTAALGGTNLSRDRSNALCVQEVE